MCVSAPLSMLVNNPISPHIIAGLGGALIGNATASKDDQNPTRAKIKVASGIVLAMIAIAFSSAQEAFSPPNIMLTKHINPDDKGTTRIFQLFLINSTLICGVIAKYFSELTNQPNTRARISAMTGHQAAAAA